MTEASNARRSTHAALAAFLVLTVGACASGAEGAPQGVAVSVTPEHPFVAPLGNVHFEAAVTGAVNTGVNWAVTGGAANGTISTEGLYTAPAGTGTFRIVATSVVDPAISGSATVDVTAAPPPPPGSLPMTSAHRTTGVAPLAVFFDAVDDVAVAGTVPTFAWTSGVVQPSDREATQYAWDFGDSGSGEWTTTGRSRNTASGYTAAHVYESPGAYTVTLAVTQTNGTVTTYTQSITVTAFTGTTYYVAANGSDSNTGTGTAAPFQSVTRGMTAALGTAGPVRVLFRRGDTFTTAGQWDITKAGPGIIGAYGSGNRPIINCSFEDGSGANIFQPSGTGADWRFMDLDIRSAGTTTSGPIGPPVDAQGVNTLLLRIASRDWNYGIGWGSWTPIFPTPHDGIFIVESESTAPSGVYGGYIGGRRLAVLGSNFHDVNGSHVLRVWMAHKAVISNSTFARTNAFRHALKLHGPGIAAREAYTKWVSITENNFIGGGNIQWIVSIGSQSDAPGEASDVSHIVYERNRHTSSAATILALEASPSHLLARNNIFDLTGCSDCSAVQYARRGTTEPVPTTGRFFNNTIWKGSGSAETAGFTIGSEALATQVVNNLFGAASTSGVSLISGTGGSGWRASNNLLTSNPGFANAGGGDFSLLAGSSAIDAGVALPEVREDWIRAARAGRGTSPDLGAFER